MPINIPDSHVVAESDYSRYVPASVLANLPQEGVKVFSVDDDASDTAQFSERFGVSLEDCANTLVLRYRKEGMDHYAAVVSLGSKRLDVNGAVKTHLGAKRLSFASREAAVELTGMEFGGITAFGVPESWNILVDAAVMQRDEVVMGAGVRTAKFLLSPKLLSVLPNVQVVAIAG